MNSEKIIKYSQIEITIAKIKKKGSSIVLVGGCFDIIHLGHIRFLLEAKKCADIMIVLLENDKKVQKIKSGSRPYFNQEERAVVLSALYMVDYVFLLVEFDTDADYNELVWKIKPDVIAATSNDKILSKKRNQAVKIGAKLKIIPFLKNYSSTKIARELGIE